MCHVGQEPDTSRTLDARIALLLILGLSPWRTREEGHLFQGL